MHSPTARAGSPTKAQPCVPLISTMHGQPFLIPLTNNFILQDAFKIIVCDMMALLSRWRWVNNLCSTTQVICSHVKRHESALQWRHNERDGVSNHQTHDCLLNRLFRHRSKKKVKAPRHWLCGGNFPTQRASIVCFQLMTAPWTIRHRNKICPVVKTLRA